MGGIRLQRYLTGDGVPSLHGNSTEGEDYLAGWDNVATPRQFAQFLQLVHQNSGLLAGASHTFFWDMLDLNEGAHRQRSAAGRVEFANNQVVVYAVFVDEGDPGAETAMENTRSCVVMHAVRQFGARTTGADVPACRGD